MGDYITLQRTTGWSSLKEYFRWDEVKQCLTLPVVELDGIKDWDQCLSLVKNARIHLGGDSVFQHAAAAYRVPAVIVFGSTSPVGSGHITAVNLSNPICGTHCFIEDRYSNGWRCHDKCPHGKCIDSIDPMTIVAAVNKFLEPCPICGCAEKPASVAEFHSPYYVCGKCGLWRQIRDLPKTFESSAELPGDQMSEPDRQANRAIAKYIQPQVHVPGKHLSIGSKYPMLGHWLQVDHGRSCAAIDGIPEVVKFGKELGVEAYQVDAEQGIPGGPYASVDMVHLLEHIYNPIEFFNKVADVMLPGGMLFVRGPNSDMEGISRDMTGPHYEIHPHVYNESSFKYLMSQVPRFKILSYTGWKPGQMDVFLERI